MKNGLLHIPPVGATVHLNREYAAFATRFDPNPPDLFGPAKVISVDRNGDHCVLFFPDTRPGTGHDGLWWYMGNGEDWGHTYAPISVLESPERKDWPTRLQHGRFQKLEFPVRPLVANLTVLGYTHDQVAEVLGISVWGAKKLQQSFPVNVLMRVVDRRLGRVCLVCGAPVTDGGRRAQYCSEHRYKERKVQFGRTKGLGQVGTQAGIIRSPLAQRITVMDALKEQDDE